MMHFPFLIPRIVLPTKMQFLFPVKILMRIMPSDCLGIDIDTALAIRAAVIERPLRRDSARMVGALASLVFTASMDVDVSGSV
jgi:hypothetical protein